MTFLIPVSAILLGVLALGERLEPHQLAGMTAIALGLVAIDVAEAAQERALERGHPHLIWCGGWS